MEESGGNVIAISAKEFDRCGCPNCGGIYGSSPISGGGSTLWNCADCQHTSVLLADGLTKSTIGIGGDNYPELQKHPRHDKPVDREKLIRERKERIESEERIDLDRWLFYGYGMPSKNRKVGSHTSKSRRLPIFATSPNGSNVRVTWFGQNYYFYFLGVEFDKPVCATLLYPISAIFGGYALSGHVNTEIAPPLGNIQKAYHNNTMVERFGADSGSGFTSALVIRYLDAVSLLEASDILDVCLRKTRYGSMDAINGNAIEFDLLTKAVGLVRSGKDTPYDFEVEISDESIFEQVQIDWHDLELGRSSVYVTLRDGYFLPAMLLPMGTTYVDPTDSLLDQYLPREKQKRPPRGTYDETIVKKIPAHLLGYRKASQDEYQALNSCVYPPNWCYSGVNPDTKNFTLNVPNVLDAAMTAFFLTRVLDPVVKMVLSFKK